MKYRHDIAYPAELTQANEHFSSGINTAGDFRGIVNSQRNVGITASLIPSSLAAEIPEWCFNGGPKLFVDSGAFSEVEFTATGPIVKNAITHAQWGARLTFYRSIAETYGPRAFLVAPDRVGCQTTTLERIARYAVEIAACAMLRANIIVPVQKGDLPMSEMFRRSWQDALGFRTAPIAGVPMKKDATSLEDLAELVDSLPWYGARIHLLGIGPESKRFASVIRCIKSRRPNCAITSDSVTLRRLVGRTNGRGGGPRAITRYQDEARASGISASVDVKSYAIQMQGADEYEAELDAALDAGWFDVELFDTIEEARAHREESRRDRKAQRSFPFDSARVAA